MLKGFGKIICDRCRTILGTKSGIIFRGYTTIKSKHGKTLHYCTDKECYSQQYHKVEENKK